MTPIVSVIVTHHLDRAKPALELCLRSILRSAAIPYELILVSDAETEPSIPTSDGANCIRSTVYQDKSLNLASLKVNWAVKNAVHKDSQYLWLVSDDVIVGKWTMNSLVDGQEVQAGIHNPMSNSDNGSQFLTHMPFNVKESPSDDLLDRIERYECGPLSSDTVIVLRQWVAFYCTMITKKAWDAVGSLDENLDYRHNDSDYCIRAAQLGIPSFINFGAFAVHLGDQTLPYCTTPEDLNRCTEIFYAKHGIKA